MPAQRRRARQLASSRRRGLFWSLMRSAGVVALACAPFALLPRETTGFTRVQMYAHLGRPFMNGILGRE